MSEGRYPMYSVTQFLVSHYWGKPADMADGLGVLLLTWNNAFYRYGIFDFDKLEACIRKHIKKLGMFRSRSILSMSDSDEKDIKLLFNDFLKALQIADGGKAKGKRSPVAVAKALHMLAPKFLPLWDDRIARAYGCHYTKNPAENYIKFCRIMRDMAKEVKGCVKGSKKSVLKVIDEYNYAKYTKGWV